MEKVTAVFGYKGMVGSAICRNLENAGINDILKTSREDIDLLDQSNVVNYFKDNKIDYVYLAAAKVGGIYANNTYPAEFIYENLMIQSNVIHSAYLSGVKKLLFLGSSCIYPKDGEQPIKESDLLTNTLEPTNEPYAIAKIAGIKMCESYNRQYETDFRSIMPTNLYGPEDNFHPENSHVIPAMMRRFHEATINNCAKVTVWGTGLPMREFLHVDDMAEASVFLMDLESDIYKLHTNSMLSHVNVGTGIDCSIKELSELMADVTGFKGEIVFDKSKPDGTLRKLLDVSRLNSFGWKSKITLENGLKSTYEWFKNNYYKV